MQIEKKDRHMSRVMRVTRALCQRYALNQQEMKKEKKNILSQSIKIPIRIGKSNSVSSLSLKKSIVALWILLHEINAKEAKGKLIDFVYKCVDLWEEDNAKGFSDFVTERLIKDMLDIRDFKEYLQIRGTLL